MADGKRVVAVLGYSGRHGGGLHRICAARLRRAEQLAGEGDTVILSGWAPRPSARSEAALMEAAWQGPGVDLVLDTDATSTAGNARSIAALARAAGADELIAVTSSWHRPRASALLRAALVGSGIRLRTVAAPRTRPPLLLARELACLIALPPQLVAARRRRPSH